MIAAYRIIIWLAVILGSPYLLVKALMGRHGISERFGFVKGRTSSSRLFWFHAASVGELKIISSLLPLIHAIDSAIEFAISTTTITGRIRAEELFGDQSIVFLAPLELKSAINRVIDRVRPEKLIIIETELWPLMLATAKDKGIDIVLVNARMSRSSYKKYRLIKALFSVVLSKFSKVLAQSAEDADRFRRLGADNVELVGNLKYDQVFDKIGSNGPPLTVSDPEKMVVVAGSVRKGEDEILARVIAKSYNAGLDVAFILAPRHMKEINDISRVLAENNIRFVLRTELNSNHLDLDKVILLNTMGELRDFYRIADIAFIGGSLVKIGGHDPLEPAALGKAVVFGPHMENAREAAQVLLESGGARVVRGVDDLYRIIAESVSNRDSLKVMGEDCKQAILSVTGASRKVAEILTGYVT